MTHRIPADDLLARTRALYASCDSYSDEGEMSEVFTPVDPTAGHGHTNRRTFATRWRRPDRFRFEYRNQMHRTHHVIWSSAGITRSWWTVQPETQRWESLEQAVAVAAGVSGGTSWFVADLLRGQPSDRGVPTVARGYWGEQGNIDATTCLWIPMQLGERSMRRLWIDVATGALLRVDQITHHEPQDHTRDAEELLRRLESEELCAEASPEVREILVKHARERVAGKGVGAFTTESTTRYHPRFNLPIDDAAFEFEPPRAG